ncbi:DUF4159 domain-containing protein [Fimbriiglobus ruber]|uniref:DUF4159 domain-containing protein n=1 Tax=Fimbriiglobus ruber TaxID=1908690 RepID=A0A225DSN9_9BACT|nr:DUF4159 domain-containing protein [Fimbriiglobus ruber]OWK44500.1 hypothetical protein FRUB_02432 [Fimbriiglobus ruber]
MPRFRLTPLRAALGTVLVLALCTALAAVTRNGLAISAAWVIAYVLGLAWAVFGVERAAQRIERRRALATSGRVVVSVGGEATAGGRGWNPLDPAARLYGRSGQRLRQSFVVLAAYSLFFLGVYFLAHLSLPKGALEPYELPSGGGSDSIQATTVKVQKVVRKKYVINPYSSILFSPPPLDKVEVKLTEETQNLYQVGQGSAGTGDGAGEGAGFGGGTGTGKVRFLRLRHSDRGWDKNFGIGGDRNMLAEYAARTRQKVGEETEYLDPAQLAAFPAKKSPPLIYVSGTQSLPLTPADKRVLNQYLTERHGMILGDNLGGQGFHHNFIAVMNEVTGTTPVAIPRDDRIHQRPYAIPQLPVVVAHGGTTPLGWKIDGRWVVYYHPGALGDAWRDDHAGIKKDVYEMCYQLGVNIIYYAHREYNQWLISQKP